MYCFFLFFFVLTVPTAVRNLTAVFNATLITVTWEVPEMPNGIVSYAFSIVGTDLATDITVLNQSETLNSTGYLVTAGTEAYSMYAISVTPLTIAGEGSAESTTFSTPEGGKCYLGVQSMKLTSLFQQNTKQIIIGQTFHLKDTLA